MTRYDIYKSTQPQLRYQPWLRRQLTAWAAQSGRARQMELERADGWYFPVLLTEAHTVAFDRWLHERFGFTYKPMYEDSERVN